MTTVDFQSKEDAVQYCERNGIFTCLIPKSVPMKFRECGTGPSTQFMF